MTAVVDIRIPKAAEASLVANGFSVVKLPPHPTLPRPVASHPDMLVFFDRDCIFCTRSYFEIAKQELEVISENCQKPIRLVSDEVGFVYPRDILLNAAPLGDRLICHSKHTARELTALYKVIPVKQGYAKCSTAIIGDNAIITADSGIAKKAAALGIDVLKVSAAEGAIELEGYGYGFIGGACALFENTLYSCGNIELHPDYEAIRDFCEAHGVALCSLTDGKLCDVGGIIFIN